MTINYSEEYDFTFDFDYKDIALKVVTEALKHEQFPYDAELGISYVDEEVIRRLNKDYRDIDRVTDVLSFPMIDYGNIDSSYSVIVDPDNNEVNLGDIVLCIPKVISQAKEYNHSILREYSFLIAHSMLHLLGYDHIDDDERAVMEDKQNEILESLEISRDL